MDQFLWNTMIFYPFLAFVLGLFFLRLCNSLVIKPRKIRKILLQQGIQGPPPRVLVGNIVEIKKSQDTLRSAVIKNQHPPVVHDTSSVFAILEHWRKQYGQVYTFSLGTMQVVYVSKPDLVKEITTYTSPDLGRPSYHQRQLGPLLGQGLLTSNGTTWSKQRKIIAPELYIAKVKGMLDIVVESALTLVNSWKHEIDACKNGVVEITVDDYMKRFSGQIISKACFGSSYSEGQEIFLKFGFLQEIISSKMMMSLGIPGLRYLPTRSNRQIWSLEKEIQTLILKVVEERQRAGAEKDLLQILLESAKSSYTTSESINQFIVDNCKNIYLAGFETSAVAASWCLMLLASNPNWQTRVRNEVNEICQGQIPNMDMLNKMKQLTMVIQETLRLYPSSATLAREAMKDMNIGDLRVPKGANIWAMIAPLHTDTAIWGHDALEFKPERFRNGIAGACKSPSSYMPFGFGQRVCIGQNLAMVELKLLMATILSNFCFELSPNYIHSLAQRMIIEPKYGVKIMVQKL